MSTPFDPSLYNRSPLFTLHSGITLARTLAGGCPKGMPKNVLKAAKRLSTVADVSDNRSAAKTMLMMPTERISR